MALLSLVYAPDPIFKQKATEVKTVDDGVRKIADDMMQTMEFEQAVGMGANMVGLLQRIVVVNLNENGVANPYVFINPEITWRSDEMQEHEEASLCFVGISANVTRPKSIKLRYLDYDGKPQELQADDFLRALFSMKLITWMASHSWTIYPK